ncbi:MAG: AsmA-like C-terminal region-containing protein [Desulfovibrio sp.]|nr:AsmA-like C-terminal region-containing protein [Desulfovibrio sp.]
MNVKRILPVLLLFVFLAAGLAGLRHLAATRVAHHLQAAGIELQTTPAIAFFPPAIRLGAVAWQGQIRKIGLRFSASDVQASPRLASLLTGRLSLEEVRISAPVIRLSEAGGRAPASLPQAFPEIGRIVCQDGSLRWQRDGESVALDNLRLTAANIRPRAEFELQGDFLLACSGAGLPNVTGNSALRAKVRYYAPNLSVRDLHATATLTAPDSLASLSPLTLELSGSLDLDSGALRLQAAAFALPGFEITGNGLYGDGAFQGECALASTRPLPFASSLKLASRLLIHDRRILLPAIAASLDSCKGAGAMEISYGAGAPKARASFKMGALQLAGARPYAAMPGLPQLPPLPDFQLDVAFTEIRAGNFSIGQPELELAGGSGIIELRRFSCRPGQGKLVASGSVDSRQDLWRLAATGEDLPLGELLALAGLEGFTDGPASLELEFALPVENGRFALPRLTGFASLAFRDLRLAFLRELTSLLPLLGPVSEIQEVVKNGRIGLKAADGMLDISPFRFSGEGLAGQGQGRLDLADKTLRGDFDLVLGRLEIPVSVSGPLARPDISVRPPLWKKRP